MTNRVLVIKVYKLWYGFCRSAYAFGSKDLPKVGPRYSTGMKEASIPIAEFVYIEMMLKYAYSLGDLAEALWEYGDVARELTEKQEAQEAEINKQINYIKVTQEVLK